MIQFFSSECVCLSIKQKNLSCVYECTDVRLCACVWVWVRACAMWKDVKLRSGVWKNSRPRMSLFTCFPSFVSQSGWWRPALQTPLAICFPGCPSLLLVSLHVSPSVPAAVRLSGCLSLLVSLLLVFQCALWMSLLSCLPVCVVVPLLTCVPNGVRLSGCLCLLVSLHVPPNAYTVLVSGSSDVSLHLPPLFVSQYSGCLSLLVSLHLFPSVLVFMFGSRMSLFCCLPSFVSQCT